MSPVLFWFRRDLRLTDNPCLLRAIARADAGGAPLVLAFCDDTGDDAETAWGFERVGPHRRGFTGQALGALTGRIEALGGRLARLRGEPAGRLSALAREIGTRIVVCEAIAAPEEEAQVAALRASGLEVEAIWQSSLHDPAALPFAPADLPEVFTPFRKALEAQGVAPPAPRPAPERLPPCPADLPGDDIPAISDDARPADARSSFPFARPEFHGGEAAALAHLEKYFSGPAPQAYKATRNGLSGFSYSTKVSPWLATGAVSARTVAARLARFEAERGAGEGPEWIRFELLWRDYFRFLHLKHGTKLFRAGGLTGRSAPPHDQEAFAAWTTGETGQPFVDAGMRELAATGYLSNRLRQVAASFLIHDLGGDWRRGAAWFEARLIDYDVYSNQGNWLYIAGLGTDPRGGRRFDPISQARTYDPDGAYQALWATP